ncbi:MAG: CDP-glycerol glycerophosphotransferase family protein [Bacteroides sp.]|nr:CDP-glycerol glycerophosphotransferase family protein [Bacteroides sp.]
MKKHYLFFASLTYAYSILRPLQEEIRRRNDVVAWYLEDSCPNLLQDNEVQLKTFEEVFRFNPIAVFAPGNWVYDFFPGVKVAVFHGYPMKKRIEKIDDHFTLRGWFDIYCTQGQSSTPYFSYLEKKHRYFKIYETGWCKVDSFFDPKLPPEPHREIPAILYAPTFTKGISSAWDMAPVIEKLAKEKEWNWIITFHPKLDDPVLLQQYKDLAQKCPNVDFRLVNKGLETFRESDVLLCDSSSLIVEYMMLDKPVVTFRNTHPGPFLLDVQTKEEVGPAIEKALNHPAELMEEIHRYTSHHESHRDGQNSARVLNAVDDFIANYQGHIPSKPLNLFRKLKLRWQLKYFKW